MKSPMAKIGLGAAVIAVIMLVVIAFSVRAAFKEQCEVCISFRGRSACRAAYGKTQDEAIQTATNNTCAMISSGMTDSISCGKTPPQSVTCEP